MKRAACLPGGRKSKQVSEGQPLGSNMGHGQEGNKVTSLRTSSLDALHLAHDRCKDREQIRRIQISTASKDRRSGRNYAQHHGIVEYKLHEHTNGACE